MVNDHFSHWVDFTCANAISAHSNILAHHRSCHHLSLSDCRADYWKFISHSFNTSVLTIPFQLLVQLAIVFLTAWQTYLFMTFTFLHHLPPVTRANIIVLGAGIYTEAVTPMLKARLDRAIALSRQLEKVHIIVSGGQGPDEPISEALAMQRYLIQQGIAPKQITMERPVDQYAPKYLLFQTLLSVTSTTTYHHSDEFISHFTCITTR